MNAASQSGHLGGTPLVAGLDIGTTSLKAVLVDESGSVVARAKLPSRVSFGPGDRLQHDARATWWEGPRAALAALLGQAGGLRAAAVSAMMPSVAPVSEVGEPVGPGLLYGSAGTPGAGDPTSSDEMERLAALCAASFGSAFGYWPAQAVANASLGGAGVVDLASAFAAGGLFAGSGWDEAALARLGSEPARMPRVAAFGEAVGELVLGRQRGDPAGVGPKREGQAQLEGCEGAVLGAGSVDGLCEQLLAGASQPGDVLITLGSTLVVWLCVPGWPEEVPEGLWRVPHLEPGMAMVGGASNAGGLWVDWVERVLRPSGEAGELAGACPGDVPVWWPWPRGERVPWHDGSLRVGLAGAHLSHGPANLRRAALEATGFVVRLILGRAAACGTPPRRYLVSGGGVANRAWLQAVAEVLGAAIVPMCAPEGAALGAAFLARMAVGLETSLSDAARWARWGDPVQPRPEWADAAGERFERWSEGLPSR